MTIGVRLLDGVLDEADLGPVIFKRVDSPQPLVARRPQDLAVGVLGVHGVCVTVMRSERDANWPRQGSSRSERLGPAE